MRRFDLGMSVKYCPQWGIVEAVREFFQNGLDEERADSSHKFYWEYDPETMELVVGNENCKLDTKSLLLGMTTKTGKAEMIGQHGEGYKVATVVLMRLGKKVVIYNRKANEQWESKIVKSRRYQADVVVFDISKISLFNRIQECSLVFSIQGVTPEEFEAIKKSNLHLQTFDERDYISTEYGDILLDEAHSGRFYVGGLAVTRSKYAKYGYNFKPEMVSLDRDRSFMDNIDTQFLCSKTLAASGNSDLIYDAKSVWDGHYLQIYTGNVKADFSTAFDRAYEAFVRKNGADAIPVTSQDEFNRLIRNGYKAVMVTDVERHFISCSTHFQDMAYEMEDDNEATIRQLRDWWGEYSGEHDDWYNRGNVLIEAVSKLLSGEED